MAVEKLNSAIDMVREMLAERIAGRKLIKLLVSRRLNNGVSVIEISRRLGKPVTWVTSFEDSFDLSSPAAVDDLCEYVNALTWKADTAYSVDCGAPATVSGPQSLRMLGGDK
jgi:hypothetical protein